MSITINFILALGKRVTCPAGYCCFTYFVKFHLKCLQNDTLLLFLATTSLLHYQGIQKKKKQPKLTLAVSSLHVVLTLTEKQNAKCLWILVRINIFIFAFVCMCINILYKPSPVMHVFSRSAYLSSWRSSRASSRK